MSSFKDPRWFRSLIRCSVSSCFRSYSYPRNVYSCHFRSILEKKVMFTVSVKLQGRFRSFWFGQVEVPQKNALRTTLYWMCVYHTICRHNYSSATGSYRPSLIRTQVKMLTWKLFQHLKINKVFTVVSKMLIRLGTAVNEVLY